MSSFGRFFGRKDTTPVPSLTEVASKVDGRGDDLTTKINKLEHELRDHREKMKKMRPGPAMNLIKQRAMRTLKQKRMYEQQRDQLMQQSFNLEQTSFASENMKDTIDTVKAMKSANKTIKQQFKKVNIDEIENLQDDMEDLLEQSNEVNEALARSYAISDDIDECDLDAELDALGDDFEAEMEDEGGVPSYMAAVPDSEPSLTSGGEMLTEGAGGGGDGAYPQIEQLQ
eukprot:TRINITY_DN1078_c0_g1_i1.p1 TRINITY_DN1078_c0_g1~~TRINITY_DN1078_c0_g1_i1.p1  ORF type:complete len:228 (+),score=77.79 TRINITY_DN1078_c0_g1_i1:447-1130(+)